MSFIGDIFDTVTGKSAQEAATQAAGAQESLGREALAEQRAAREQAIGFLTGAGESAQDLLRQQQRQADLLARQAGVRADLPLRPYAQLGRQGLSQAGFLTDPQAQFEFLQSNPLFNLALENVNRQTQQQAAAAGRLSAGDTLQQLASNTLLAAQPLIDRQRSDILNLLGMGRDIAGQRSGIEQQVGMTRAGMASGLGSQLAGIEQQQAQSLANAALGSGTQISNILQDIGNVQASGIMGGSQARQQGVGNLIGLGSMFISPFSGTRAGGLM